MLALLAPLLALSIENLETLKAKPEDIINLYSGEPQPALLRGCFACCSSMFSPASDLPKDCSEIRAASPSGVYVIQPTGLPPIVVNCDMSMAGGGWTVIQRNNHSTEITWAESWTTYKYGFGNVLAEYWLGTEYIHQISKQKVYQVRFVIWKTSNTTKFADYNLFYVEEESQGYRLRLGVYSGTAGDAMSSNSASSVHDNMKFSAKDRDQDTSSVNCASNHGGAWWYSGCYSAQLNVKGDIAWGSLCSGNCKASAILIKPAPYC
ncbi:FGL1L protein, partial [Indicator maculatus]|nr:FGL1L protein [Indicator maculatus]